MLILILVGYWFTAIQVNITFPLWAEFITGNEQSVGIMYSMIAVLTIAFQLPLVNFLSKHLPSHYILLLGIVVMSVSIMAIGLFSNFYLFLGSVALFTLGALLTKPTQQTLIANHADKEALGLFMGFSSLALGIGGGIGSFSGGWLFDLSKEHALPALPWMVFGIVGVICALALYAFIQKRIIPNL
jgi:DHA1 family multidrug resistance protein-like MFS transporter